MKAVFVVLLGVLLSACATQPKTPKAPITVPFSSTPYGDKFAIWVVSKSEYVNPDQLEQVAVSELTQKRFTVVARSDELRRILEEQRIQTSEEFNFQDSVKLGELAGAHNVMRYY